MADKRFVVSYTNGIANNREIIVDTQTGVNYLIVSSSKSSGCAMSILVDKEGNPIITPSESIK